MHFSEYAEYEIEGEDWYERSMRTRANCVENLPVYGAIVVVIVATGMQATALDALALIVIGARVLTPRSTSRFGRRTRS